MTIISQTLSRPWQARREQNRRNGLRPPLSPKDHAYRPPRAVVIGVTAGNDRQ